MWDQHLLSSLPTLTHVCKCNCCTHPYGSPFKLRIFDVNSTNRNCHQYQKMVLWVFINLRVNNINVSTFALHVFCMYSLSCNSTCSECHYTIITYCCIGMSMADLSAGPHEKFLTGPNYTHKQTFCTIKWSSFSLFTLPNCQNPRFVLRSHNPISASAEHQCRDWCSTSILTDKTCLVSLHIVHFPFPTDAL